MSILHFDAVTAASAGIPELSLNGGFASSSGFKTTGGGFKWDNLGRSFKIQNGANIQINTSTDWIEPNVVYDPADYEIRWHETFLIIEDGHIDNIEQVHSTGWTEDTFLPLDSVRRIEYFCYCF